MGGGSRRHHPPTHAAWYAHYTSAVITDGTTARLRVCARGRCDASGGVSVCDPRRVVLLTE